MLNKTETEIMKNWRSDTPIVSIFSLAYNHEKFISKALDSMLAQETDFPYEIIVHDDFSTDNTAEIIKQYAKLYPNIVKPVLSQENLYSQGISITQKLMTIAKGKYIAYCECDDYWRDPEKLQKQVNFLEKNPDYVLSYHNSIIVDENDKLIDTAKNKQPKDYTQEEMLCAEAFILTNTVMYRNVPIKRPTKYGKILNADTLFWHLLGHYGKAKYQKEIKPSAYRVHGGGIWSGLDSVQRVETSIKIRRILIDLLQGNEILQNRLANNIDNMVAGKLADGIIHGKYTTIQVVQTVIKKDPSLNEKKYHIYRLCMKNIVDRIKSKILRKKIDG